MILIPSVSAERVTSCTVRPARRNAMTAPVSQRSACADGTKIVGAVPAKTHRVIRPNDDGRSIISDNGKPNGRSAQFACWRPTCWQKNMLQEESVGNVT